MPGGKSPGPSIKNAKQYEKLKSLGMSKSQAAAISNASWNKGHSLQGAARRRLRRGSR